MTELGLRERKKAATRALIARTAEKLFSKHGFDNVTIERVADECMISAKTVLRYYPTKEMLALARLFDLVDSFKEELESRDGSVLDYWCQHISDAVREEEGQIQILRRYINMLHEQPGLEAHLGNITRRYEEVLAEAFADESGDDGFGPRLLAALLVSANSVTTRYWLQGEARPDPEEWVRMARLIAERYPVDLVGKKRARRSKR
jgi:AcrR family transcriptional regulator